MNGLAIITVTDCWYQLLVLRSIPALNRSLFWRLFNLFLSHSKRWILSVFDWFFSSKTDLKRGWLLCLTSARGNNKVCSLSSMCVFYMYNKTCFILFAIFIISVDFNVVQCYVGTFHSRLVFDHIGRHLNIDFLVVSTILCENDDTRTSHSSILLKGNGSKRRWWCWLVTLLCHQGNDQTGAKPSRLNDARDEPVCWDRGEGSGMRG